MTVVESPDSFPNPLEAFLPAEPMHVPQPHGEVSVVGPLRVRQGPRLETGDKILQPFLRHVRSSIAITLSR